MGKSLVHVESIMLAVVFAIICGIIGYKSAEAQRNVVAQELKTKVSIWTYQEDTVLGTVLGALSGLLFGQIIFGPNV